MTPMDKYNQLKAIRDMHKNMTLVAVTADVRAIHARHAVEFQGMIEELRADVVRRFEGAGV